MEYSHRSELFILFFFVFSFLRYCAMVRVASSVAQRMDKYGQMKNDITVRGDAQGGMNVFHCQELDICERACSLDGGMSLGMRVGVAMQMKGWAARLGLHPPTNHTQVALAK